MKQCKVIEVLYVGKEANYILHVELKPGREYCIEVDYNKYAYDLIWDINNQNIIAIELTKEERHRIYKSLLYVTVL